MCVHVHMAYGRIVVCVHATEVHVPALVPFHNSSTALLSPTSSLAGVPSQWSSCTSRSFLCINTIQSEVVNTMQVKTYHHVLSQWHIGCWLVDMLAWNRAQ